jgi:hypothetical protein
MELTKSPELVDPERIELSLSRCKRDMLPLSLRTHKMSPDVLSDLPLSGHERAELLTLRVTGRMQKNPSTDTMRKANTGCR